MSATDLETYAGQLARLKRDYIVTVGEEIGWALATGKPAAVNYEPGNGTCYALAFTPVHLYDQLGDRFVPPGLQGDGVIPKGWTVVAQPDGSAPWAWPFDLSHGQLHHPSYVGPHIGRNLADAAALTALFRAITGVPLEIAD